MASRAPIDDDLVAYWANRKLHALPAEQRHELLRELLRIELAAQVAGEGQPTVDVTYLDLEWAGVVFAMLGKVLGSVPRGHVEVWEPED